MISSFINFLDPFKIGDLLSMPYLCALEITITRINLYLSSIIANVSSSSQIVIYFLLPPGLMLMFPHHFVPLYQKL